MKPSPFYNKIQICSNDLAFVIEDDFPVSKGHCLIVPKRMVRDFFELSPDEVLAIQALLHKMKEHYDTTIQPDGYNIGTNCGVEAGQSIAHCHIHLIPRFSGDTANPKGGGVRYVKAVKIKTGQYADFRPQNPTEELPFKS